MLEMMWHCDVCDAENICEVPRETHFFGVIHMATRDHESINPSCAWERILVRLFHPPRPSVSSHDKVPLAISN